MRKQVFGRKLQRDTNERKALFKGLMNDLVMNESLKTTEEKAKAIKGQVEKLITKAKNRGTEARKFLSPYLESQAVEKVIVDLAVRFEKRPGGYTRIIKTGNRFSDNASMVIMEWVEKNSGLSVMNEDLSSKGKSANETQASKEKKNVEMNVKIKDSKKEESPKATKKKSKPMAEKVVKKKGNSSK